MRTLSPLLASPSERPILTQDPKVAVEKLYQHFEWTMSDAFRARLAAAANGEREFQRQHDYTLEEFGLSKEWVQEELSPLLDYYSRCGPLTSKSPEDYVD